MRPTPVRLLTSAWIALCAAVPVFGDSTRPGKILIDNHCNEPLTVTHLRVRDSAGGWQDHGGGWDIKSGDRTFLLTADSKDILGHQAEVTVRTRDGVEVKGNGYGLDDGTVWVRLEQHVVNDARDKDTTRELTKAERTRRYWLIAQRVQVAETLAAVQKVGFLEVSKLIDTHRTIAEKVEKLDTTGVDEDAVAPARELARFFEKMASVSSKRIGTNGIVPLFDSDERARIRRENDELVDVQEKLYKSMRSTKEKLAGRYGKDFPDLMAPVAVALDEFTFSKGYYVLLINQSGGRLTGVKVRYNKGSQSYYQDVGELIFQAKFDLLSGPKKLDPDDIHFTVGLNQSITITWDGGGYTYSTNDLIKR